MLNDVWYESLTRRDEVLVRWVRVLKEGEVTLGAQSVAGGRLAESAEFFEFMITELEGMLDRWKARHGGGVSA
ncbi:hypothetical protein [Kitasatospora sp. NPDC091207]|uniref:hypothetical protein n=1 Tax=Kitasatospora sp. NPDC091207 TaxID=3364083 RepID=UPI0037F7AE46